MTQCEPWRRSLRPADWPASDRAAWARALQPGDVFADDVGPAAHWRQGTIDMVAAGYGHWLQFLAETRGIDPAADPAARVTRDSLGAYVDALRACVRQGTIIGRVASLAAALRVMRPRADRRLLGLTLARLRAEPRGRKPKLHRMVPADRLYGLGFALMPAALAMAEHDYRWRALWRDGLLIAFLAARPLRLRSLVSLVLGGSILRGDGVWLLRVAGENMKTHRAFEAPLPVSLTAALDRYVDEIRPGLLGAQQTDAFWLTIAGRPMTRPGVRAQVCALTRQHLGVSVHPHLFRHCVATSVAVVDPAHVGISAQLLGHTTMGGVARRQPRPGRGPRPAAARQRHRCRPHRPRPPALPGVTATRAVVYARYSSDQQRDASVEDQIEVCRRYAERQGWTVTKVYLDRAQSGGSRFRDGFRQLLVDAEAHCFDVVLAEALDRLGRKLADVADLHDRLTFLRIGLHTASTGEVTAMHVGLLGTMAQMFLKDLAEKTRRGQLGRVLKGKVAGGKAFGYVVVEPAGDDGRGVRRIDPAEAETVRRIFRAFADGRSARVIAAELNAERVPGPDGREWRDTTIRGQVDRGTGLLNNALYAGRLEWNRCSYVKDPRTGKRVARPNPRDQWEVVPVPELRIVDDELWGRVKARQAEVGFTMARDASGNALNRTHRPKRLLAGLVVCGACGGKYTTTGRDHLACSTQRAKGTCTNRLTLRWSYLEHRVLSGLKERLLAPELLEAFLREVEAERRRLAQADSRTRRRAEKCIGEVERKIAAIIRAIEDGMYQPAMKARMTELEAERAALRAELEAPEPTPVEMHPNLPAIYRRKVEALERTLNDPAVRADAADILRSHIDRLEVLPGAAGDGKAQVILHGDLARILGFCAAAEADAGKSPGHTVASKSKRPAAEATGRQVSVVAGACNHRGFPAGLRPRSRPVVVRDLFHLGPELSERPAASAPPQG